MELAKVVLLNFHHPLLKLEKKVSGNPPFQKKKPTMARILEKIILRLWDFAWLDSLHCTTLVDGG